MSPAKMPTVEFISNEAATAPPPTGMETPAKIMARRYASIGQKARASQEAPKPAPAPEPGKTEDPGSATTAPPAPTEGKPLTSEPAPAPSPQDKPQPDPEDKGQPKPGDKEPAKANDGQAPKPEQAATEQKEGQDKNLAKAWASVMRKDREVQKALAEVREYQKDQAGYNEYRQNKESFETFKKAQSLITSDPDEALRLLGAKGGYNEISERMLDRISKGEVKSSQDRVMETLLAKIDGLEKRLEESGKSAKAREQEEAKNAVQTYIGQLDTFIKAKPDDFPLVIANQAAPLVFDTMKAYYEAHGKYLSEQEASELVENHFRKQARELISKPAVRKALELASPAPEDKKPAPAAKPDQSQGSAANDEPPKTLTNSMPTGGVPVVERNHTLSREEQIRRLVARKYGGSQAV